MPLTQLELRAGRLHRRDADVVVVGAGCAGMVAAIAAARRGAHVVLVEREGSLGGTSTAVLDTFYGFFTPGENAERIVDGVPWEVVRRLRAAGASFDRPNTYGAGTGVTYNPEVLRALWDELAFDAGVEVLLHTSVTDVTVEDRRVSQLLLTSGSELIEVHPDHVVDASGEAVVAHLAGNASEGFSDIPNPQSLTVTFAMAPVDMAAVERFGRAALLDAMRDASATKGYDLPRHDGSLHETMSQGVCFMHMTKVSEADPRDPWALSRAEREGRAQALEYARFLRDLVPGFERAQVCWMSRRAGIRESRRVRGRHWLTRDDVVEGRRFDDAVAQAGAPIEEHTDGAGTRWEFLEGGRTYDIPFASLLPDALDAFAVAGRCLSASHDAHASARNMAPCMAMGQAAGTAAALGADSGVVCGDLETAVLHKALLDDGVLFGGASLEPDVRERGGT